jgi:hypothetical protein
MQSTSWSQGIVIKQKKSLVFTARELLLVHVTRSMAGILISGRNTTLGFYEE